MARSKSLVLVVEDDPAMLHFIRRTLEINDLSVVAATDGLAALDLEQIERPDLAVLDLAIPEMDGLELCRRLRTNHQVPIIMVTARGEVDDVVRGFEAGAEDYLAKPFAGRVLVARIKALLHRALIPSGTEGDRIQCGELVVDMSARRVTSGGHVVHVTPTEYGLLALLARHRDRVLTHQQIITELWGTNYEIDAQALRSHIGRLRKKIESDRSKPSLICTERGVGYWLSCPTSPTGV